MQNNVSSFTVCFPFDSEVLLQIHSRLGQFIVFSRKNMQFTEIIYHRKRKNQGGLPPCKHRRCAFNQKHIHLLTGGNFTGSASWPLHKRNEMERLHKQGFSFFVKMWRKNFVFWVKSFCWHKSVKRRLASSFAIFLAKKWRRGGHPPQKSFSAQF